MLFTVRMACPEDAEEIVPWTTDTFEWGDYVVDQFDQWSTDPNGLLMVGVDDGDTAISMSRAAMVSPIEAWFQGARVREDWRREGVAGAMAAFGADWARERGARVARLIVEEANEPARKQVEHDGFRNVGDWVRARRAVGEASPLPAGNGGRRVPAQEQLVRAHASEAVPAYMSWSAGSLARPSRGLFAVGWTWRRLAQSDLEQAAKHEALWTARSGWVMAAMSDAQLEVGWLETREDDAVDLLRAIVDLASKLDAEGFDVTMPATPWLTAAARRAGCELLPLTVYETSL